MEMIITNPIMMQAASNFKKKEWYGLSFVAEEDSTIKYNASSAATAEYSTNLNTWHDANGVVLQLKAGREVFFRGNITGMQSEEKFAHFEMTGKVVARGNIESMGSMHPYCYFNLFYGCSALLEAPNLPTMELAEGCYKYMFLGCTNLKSAPELPALYLTPYCYFGMFGECDSLTEPPSINAVVLAEGCCKSMFSGCDGLVFMKYLYATTLAPECYSGMFENCTHLRNCPPELPATILATSCYQSMFSGCTALLAPPKLPATTLAPSCYQSMFSGCTSLPGFELPATILVTSCYQSMFSGCNHCIRIKCMAFMIGPEFTWNWVQNVASAGTFIKNIQASWEEVFDESFIPTGWTVETATA